VDSDGQRTKGQVFSVGSGSLYAYGVLDAGYKWCVLHIVWVSYRLWVPFEWGWRGRRGCCACMQREEERREKWGRCVPAAARRRVTNNIFCRTDRGQQTLVSEQLLRYLPDA